MAPVNKGSLHATAHMHKVLGWVIEIWEDGNASPVRQITYDRKPLYKDKLRELNVLIQERIDGKAKTKEWEDWNARADAQNKEAYGRRPLAVPGEPQPRPGQPVPDDKCPAQEGGLDHLQAPSKVHRRVRR